MSNSTSAEWTTYASRNYSKTQWAGSPRTLGLCPRSPVRQRLPHRCRPSPSPQSCRLLEFARCRSTNGNSSSMTGLGRKAFFPPDLSGVYLLSSHSRGLNSSQGTIWLSRLSFSSLDWKGFPSNWFICSSPRFSWPQFMSRGLLVSIF